MKHVFTLLILFPWLLGSQLASADQQKSLSIGPSALYVMPGAVVRLDYALAEQTLILGEIHGETLSGSKRLGLRTGVDFFPMSETTSGFYVGARLGSWLLLEESINTWALQAGGTLGWRGISDSGWVIQGGAGLQPRLVLSGDGSWQRPLVPTLELRIGRLLK